MLRYDADPRILLLLKSLIPEERKSWSRGWLYWKTDDLYCSICEKTILNMKQTIKAMDYQKKINTHILTHLHKNLISFI